MVEDALKAFVALVDSHYETSTEPLYLATAGQRLGQHRKPLVDAFGTLAGAIKHVGPAKLDLVVPEGQPGRALVVTPAARASVEARLHKARAGANGAVSPFRELPFPIQIAFCLRTEEGEQVAVRTSPPIRYTKLPRPEGLPAGYVVVESQYRSPGLKVSGASITDLERLWLNYKAWANAHDIDPDRLAQAAPAGSALERFLALQDPEVKARIVLPADIAAILLRHN